MAPDPQTTYTKEKDPFIGVDKPPRPQTESLPVTKVLPESATAATPGAVTTPEATESGAAAATAGTGEGSVIEQIRKDNWEETGKSQRPAEATATKDASGSAETDAATAPAGETEVIAPVRKNENESAETSVPEAGTVTPLIKDEASPVIDNKAAQDSAGFEKNRREEELPARLPDPAAEDAADSKDEAPQTDSSSPTFDEALPLENEQNKTSWKFTQPVRRIVLRASFSNVRIARRSATVDPDGTIPAASLTQIAGR